ncbi:MAG: FAD-dependent oxidoreductase [Planctomycetota bacterium]|jgi:protoporphyrinogen oxidase
MTTAERDPPFDVLVLGAGLRGLRAALATRRTTPTTQLLVVDRAPQPGGSVRTVRTNGFVCEHGPIGFWRDELDATLSLLQHAPTPLAALPTARSGFVFDGERRPIDVTELPWSFRTGNEELVQACRRELGSTLRLGRAVTAITAATGDGFRVALAGDPPGEVRAHELVVALPLDTTARLLGAFDPALPDVATRLRQEARALVWLGTDAAAMPEAQGYGLVPAADFASPLLEVVFCTQVFAGRALPGRALVRCEVSLPDGADEAAAIAIAERELRHWTGTQATFGLQKATPFVHLHEDDAAAIECRARLRDLAVRVPGLRFP